MGARFGEAYRTFNRRFGKLQVPQPASDCSNVRRLSRYLHKGRIYAFCLHFDINVKIMLTFLKYYFLF
jgi:hypothetical protein